MPGRTTFESPVPSPACHAPGPILADVMPGFEPPGAGPPPSTTLLVPCTTEQATASQDRADREPSEAAETPETPKEQAEASDGQAEASDGQAEASEEQAGVRAGVSVFPPIGEGEGVARWSVEIMEWAPHDPDAFTQGLEIADGTMYESTGLWGQSSLRAVDPATGEVTARVDLPAEFFGEGLTIVGDEIVQLTWRNGIALVYDRATLDLLREHTYAGEGWGLCEMGDELIMTDGSDRLARRDPRTFELLSTLTVTAHGYDGRLDHLNELECVEGMVIANVWQTDRLLVIDPLTGRVVAAIDGGILIDDVSRASTAGQIDVLNGVAVDDNSATLWMTGKLWPRLYRVRIVEVP